MSCGIRKGVPSTKGVPALSSMYKKHRNRQIKKSKELLLINDGSTNQRNMEGRYIKTIQYGKDAAQILFAISTLSRFFPS